MTHRTRENLFGMILTCSVIGAGFQSATAQTTHIDDMVMYGVDQPTSQLIRYEFGAGSRESIGTIHLANGSIVENIENLAYIPGRMYLYGVQNIPASYQSRLYKIDIFTAEATPLPNDVGYGNVKGLTIVNELERGPGESPTTVILKDSNDVDAYEVTFQDVEYNEDGTSTWSYYVRELGTGQDLSHWDLMLRAAHQVMPGTTAGYRIGYDGSTGLYGIKWDVEDSFTEGVFTIVLDQYYAGTTNATGVGVLAKGGNGTDRGLIFGPKATVPPEHTIYAVHADSWYRRNLLSIDPETGRGLITMSTDRRFDGLAASPTGRLLAIRGDYLWEIRPHRDDIRAIGHNGIGRCGALEFAFGEAGPAVEVPGVSSNYWDDGILFAFSDADNKLIMIDGQSGDAIDFAAPGISDLGLEGIIFVPQSRDLQATMPGSWFD